MKSVFTSLFFLLIPIFALSKGSQWRSQPSAEWSDWDSKNFSFKLTHKNTSVLLKCELNLAGEIFLHHASLCKKSSSACAKQGGSSTTIGSHGYCVKRVSKLNTSKFRLAFLKKKIRGSLGFFLN